MNEARATYQHAHLVVGHRGASGRLPENTLAAFRGAAEDGAGGVELDVRMSADGVPVVIHDATLYRTTGVRGRVSDQTASELAEISAVERRRAGAPVSPVPNGSRMLGVPTLDEAVAFCLAERLTMFVELKG